MFFSPFHSLCGNNLENRKFEQGSDCGHSVVLSISGRWVLGSNPAIALNV